MGVEHGLYERKSKEFIWLGKRLPDGKGFQLSAEIVAAFVADNVEGEFFMYDDCGEPPDWDDDNQLESERWRRRANWWSKSLDDLKEQEG